MAGTLETRVARLEAKLSVVILENYKDALDKFISKEEEEKVIPGLRGKAKVFETVAAMYQEIETLQSQLAEAEEIFGLIARVYNAGLYHIPISKLRPICDRIECWQEPERWRDQGETTSPKET